MRPRIIIFAGPGKTSGSGAENLVAHSRAGLLGADVVAFVSTNPHGGVAERAARLGVAFEEFRSPWNGAHFEAVVKKHRAQWVVLSGWLNLVCMRQSGFNGKLLHMMGLNHGLDPARTINIHPALLSFDNGRFGGKGMYGHRVHEAVAEALAREEIEESGFTMHFVTHTYDRGPICFEYRARLTRGMGATAIGEVVNAAEQRLQPLITDLVVSRQIRWDGMDPRSLVVPDAVHLLSR